MAKYYSSTIQKGSKGDEVKEWQKFLNSQGYNLSVDGDFGNNTYKATTEWQKKNGLTVDGIVGENTWGKAGYSNYSTISTPTSAPTVGAMPTAPTYDTTKWDDTTKGQAALGDYNSAKDAVNNYGDFTYDDYVMGEDAQSAKDALDAHLANKPAEYQSQWQSQLDSLMDSIMNREKFSYDLNGDALYQQYKDKYIQQGKMAMGDAIGQASAMTGGYGNSYAQSVGQQAYQAQLQNLNDIVPELYQMALDKYNMEGQELYNQYGMLVDRENTDYGRYRDTVSDYLTDRDYLTGRYDTESNRDYSKYVDDRNLAYTLHADGYNRLLDSLGIAQSDYYDGANMFHTEQSNSNNVLGKEFSDDMAIWQNETDQAWKQAEWNEAARQYANEEAWRQKEWDENQRRYEESKVTTSGNGGNGGNGGVDLSAIPGINTTDSSYFDDNGNFKKAEFLGTTQDGKSSFRIGGKTVVLDKGVNPYTQTYNKDCKNGTFSNGYQPNNVGGKKLSKSGIQDYMNGVLQTVWQTPDGKLWIWDGTQNAYEEYHE